MRQVLIGTAAAGIALLLLVAIFALPHEDIRLTLTQAQPGLLALALGAMLAVYPLWVWQWWRVTLPLERVSWPVMAQVVAFSVTARVTTSGIGGVAGGAAALHLQAGLSPAAAASVMAVDQVLAGMAKLAVLALALAVVPLPPAVLSAAWVIVALALGFGALAIVAHRFRGALAGAFSGPRMRRVGAAVMRFLQDFAQLATWRVLLPAGLLALAKKALEVLAALGVQMALGLEGAPYLALLAVASISLVSLVPIAPVQLGPQAVAVFATYSAFGVPPLQAAAIALVHQVLVLASTFAVAGVAFAMHLRLRHKAKSPA